MEIKTEDVTNKSTKKKKSVTAKIKKTADNEGKVERHPELMLSFD